MFRTNRINYLAYKCLIGVALVFFVFSCNDFLTTPSKSTITTKTTFSQLSTTKAAITGIYAALMGDNMYGLRLSLILPYNTDALQTSGNYNCNDRRGVSMYEPCATNVELAGPYKALYRGIQRANIAIKYIPKSNLYKNGSPEERAQMRSYYGQALTIRALLYYDLIKNWGDVPAIWKPAADISNLYLSKTSRDSIYDKVLDDLKTAAKMVPWRSESGAPPTVISKAAVLGLRARIALASGGYSLRRDPPKMERRDNYMKYYEIAYDACKAIIEQGENALNPSYENVFRSLIAGVQKDPTHELIFIVGAYGSGSAVDSQLGTYNGLMGASASKWPTGSGLKALPTYYYEFGRYDTRRYVSVGIFKINKNNKKVALSARSITGGKFRKPWTGITGPAANLHIRWPILRYSDVLLMFAEAANEINHGPTPEAIEAFNKVRKRAYRGHVDKLKPVPNSYQGFFEAIVHQRLLEFGGEGLRKYNLIRWNIIDEIFKQTVNKLEMFANRTGPYKNVPKYLYSKPSEFDPNTTAKEEAKSMVFWKRSNTYNAYHLPTPKGDPPQGYKKIEWSLNISKNVIKGERKGYFSHFQENHSELLPIPKGVINKNYNLTQDYGY